MHKKKEADKNAKCFHCGKLGHMKKDCTQFLREKGKGGSSGGEMWIHETDATATAAAAASQAAIETVEAVGQWLLA